MKVLKEIWEMQCFIDGKWRYVVRRFSEIKYKTDEDLKDIPNIRKGARFLGFDAPKLKQKARR